MVCIFGPPRANALKMGEVFRRWCLLGRSVEELGPSCSLTFSLQLSEGEYLAVPSIPSHFVLLTIDP